MVSIGDGRPSTLFDLDVLAASDDYCRSHLEEETMLDHSGHAVELPSQTFQILNCPKTAVEDKVSLHRLERLPLWVGS